MKHAYQKKKSFNIFIFIQGEREKHKKQTVYLDIGKNIFF